MLPEISITKVKDCQKCGCKVNAELVRVITTSGSSQVYWNCLQHNGAIDRPRKNIQHIKIRKHGIDIEKLPIIYDNSITVRCAVCGTIGAELHHWSPRYLFGDECEDWPTAFLCRDCHKTWHDLVTPGMCEK